jgi:dihydroorotate dehydrogenase electron transfer subunit
LRRPFSIYDVDYEKNVLSLLIKTVGDGTMALSKLKEGDILNLIYPLGNSFSLPEGEKALLIGGGVGIAPMLLLAKHLVEKGYKPDVLIGGRSSKDIIEPEKYKSFGEVFITTDDGSAGEKGMVTQHSLFAEKVKEYSIIYACGPDPMMKAVARVAASHEIPCEISLENTMACGIGACLCCVVETIEGNKTTCIEGPVFDTRKLKL